MKKLFLFFAVILLAATAKADFIQLTNGMMFHGKVLKVNDHEISFKTDLGVFFIPEQDLQCVNLDHRSKKKEKALAEMFAISFDDKCSRGTVAGQMHGHGFGHFCAGFFGSFIGVGIVMLVDKVPSKSKNLMMIANDQEVWTDPVYLTCYNQAAKKKALVNSCIGMLVGIVLTL